MSRRFQYTPSFDGLRGIAVLCVLLTHSSPWLCWRESALSGIGRLILFRQSSSLEGFRTITAPLVAFSGRTFLPDLACCSIDVSVSPLLQATVLLS